MSDQERAMRRVLKKISAMRQTFNREERDILDAIVQGSYAEVEGHRLVQTWDAERTMQRSDDEDEVVAHKVQTFDSEKQVQKLVQKAQFRVTYDPEKEVYKVQI
jgi:hypothetical protein